MRLVWAIPSNEIDWGHEKIPGKLRLLPARLAWAARRGEHNASKEASEETWVRDTQPNEGYKAAPGLNSEEESKRLDGESPRIRNLTGIVVIRGHGFEGRVDKGNPVSSSLPTLPAGRRTFRLVRIGFRAILAVPVPSIQIVWGSQIVQATLSEPACEGGGVKGWNRKGIKPDTSNPIPLGFRVLPNYSSAGRWHIYLGRNWFRTQTERDESAGQFKWSGSGRRIRVPGTSLRRWAIPEVYGSDTLVLGRRTFNQDFTVGIMAHRPFPLQPAGWRSGDQPYSRFIFRASACGRNYQTPHHRTPQMHATPTAVSVVQKSAEISVSATDRCGNVDVKPVNHNGPQCCHCGWRGGSHEQCQLPLQYACPMILRWYTPRVAQIAHPPDIYYSDIEPVLLFRAVITSKALSTLSVPMNFVIRLVIDQAHVGSLSFLVPEVSRRRDHPSLVEQELFNYKPIGDG
ncbi:hypothetical protein DFH09DRAFT_1101737 [Mycena vulgaris]|nr:hypothetical protein DFH09DRAFT_1101737 [Mycena vulgaris]